MTKVGRRGAVIAGMLMLALPAVPASAHGLGGNSSACWDGNVPGTGAESGQLGRTPFASVGVQTGTDPGVGHIFYTDYCARIETPAVSLPFVGTIQARYGIYQSNRLHTNPAQCPPAGGQSILAEDPDSTVRPIGYHNNCP